MQHVSCQCHVIRKTCIMSALLSHNILVRASCKNFELGGNKKKEKAGMLVPTGRRFHFVGALALLRRVLNSMFCSKCVYIFLSPLFQFYQSTRRFCLIHTNSRGPASKGFKIRWRIGCGDNSFARSSKRELRQWTQSTDRTSTLIETSCGNLDNHSKGDKREINNVYIYESPSFPCR